MIGVAVLGVQHVIRQAEDLDIPTMHHFSQRQTQTLDGTAIGLPISWGG